MIRNWKNNPKNREKEKKMVRYYVSAWPKKPIKGTSVFWPKYGSDEDCVYQTHICMQMIRFLFLEEESSYAACWVQEVNQLLLKKGQDQGEEEFEERTGQ